MAMRVHELGGPAPPIATGTLRRWSYLARPRLGEYTASRKEFEWRAGEVLG